MPLHPTLATIRRNLPSVAIMGGFQARVTSGFRSYAAQERLYKRYLQGLQPYPVAPPGTSEHEFGLALDVVSTNPDKLVALLRSVGLSWAGMSDPVHFALKAAPTRSGGRKQAFQSYREEVGYMIPQVATELPFFGSFFSAARDPEAFRKEQESKLWNVLLSVIGL